MCAYVYQSLHGMSCVNSQPGSQTPLPSCVIKSWGVQSGNKAINSAICISAACTQTYNTHQIRHPVHLHATSTHSGAICASPAPAKGETSQAAEGPGRGPVARAGPQECRQSTAGVHREGSL